MLHQSNCPGAFFKRTFAREQEVHRATQAVKIGPVIDVVAVEQLFGGDVIDGANHVFVVGQRDRFFVVLIDNAGHAEVQNFDLAFVSYQQVGRFDVAVNHAPVMGVLQAVAGLADITGDVSKRQLAFAFDQLLQFQADHIFHDQVVIGPVLVHIVSTHNVGVVERSGGAGSLCETSQKGGIFQQGWGQNFDGHATIQLSVFGQINGPPTTFAQDAEQFVFPQEKPGEAATPQLIVLPTGNQPGVDQFFG